MPCSLPFWFLLLQIMERALFHMDNSYKIPNIRGTGRLCKTNLPSNTAFRGFGGPQGMFIAEYWMSEVAVTCGLPAEEVSWPLVAGVGGWGYTLGWVYLGHLLWGQRMDPHYEGLGAQLQVQSTPCPGLLPLTRLQCLSPWAGAEEEPVQRRGPDTLQPEA